MKKFFLFFMIFVFVAFLCFFFFFLFTGKPIKSIFNIASGIKPTEKTIQTDENERDTFLDKTLVLESVSLYYENTVTDINNFTNPDTYDVNNFQTDKSYQTDNLIETPDYLVDDYQLLTNENNYELTFVKDNNIDISLVLPLPCVSSVVIFADSYLVPLMISLGAQAYPNLQPVIAYAFEKPSIKIVLSFMLSRLAIDTCFSL